VAFGLGKDLLDVVRNRRLLFLKPLDAFDEGAQMPSSDRVGAASFFIGGLRPELFSRPLFEIRRRRGRIVKVVDHHATSAFGRAMRCGKALSRPSPISAAAMSQREMPT